MHLIGQFNGWSACDWPAHDCSAYDWPAHGWSAYDWSALTIGQLTNGQLTIGQLTTLKLTIGQLATGQLTIGQFTLCRSVASLFLPDSIPAHQYPPHNRAPHRPTALVVVDPAEEWGVKMRLLPIRGRLIRRPPIR